MTTNLNKQDLRKRIALLLTIFILGLIVSGITAFPIETELQIAHDLIRGYDLNNAYTGWIETVFTGVAETNANYPFIAYGTDWLAFAHLVIAIAFIGPLREPVKNIWVLEFGIVACVAVLPVAIIAGAIRGIPLFWRVLDCSFGIVGGIILIACHRYIKKLETVTS